MNRVFQTIIQSSFIIKDVVELFHTHPVVFTWVWHTGIKLHYCCSDIWSCCCWRVHVGQTSYCLLVGLNIKGLMTWRKLRKASFYQAQVRVRKYAKFGVIYAKIVQMTPLRLRRESLRLQKFLATNREPLRLQKFSVTNTVLSLPFSQQIQFTLILNVVNLN